MEVGALWTHDSVYKLYKGRRPQPRHRDQNTGVPAFNPYLVRSGTACSRVRQPCFCLRLGRSPSMRL